MTKKTCLFRLFLFSVAITTIYFVNSFVAADEFLESIKLEGHTHSINSIAFSPDGKTVVTASQDGTARIWDAATGKELRKLKGTVSALRSATFSPDGKVVVTVDDDHNTGWLWDVATGKELCKFKYAEYIGYIVGRRGPFVFSPDSKFIITRFRSGIQIWDVATGKELRKFEDAYSATFSSDGKFLATMIGNDTQIWNMATGKELRKFEGMRFLAFSPDSETAVMLFRDSITMWLGNVVTGKGLHKLEGHISGVTSAVFSPDGKTIATASGDKTVRIWNVATGKELHELEHDAPVMSITFSLDGKMFVTRTRNENGWFAWDTTTGKEKESYELGRTKSVTFFPDGKMIAIATKDRYITVLVDIATGKELYEFKGIGSEVFSPNGKMIAMLENNGENALICNWDMIQQRLEREEQAKRERKAKEEQTREKNLAAGLNNLSEYLTENGFKENELWKLAQYGTADLQRQLEKADEFDKGELKKQIMIKQNEIKDKKFVLQLPYTTTNIDVNDTYSRAELIIRLPLFVNKTETAPDLHASTRAGIAHFHGGALLTNYVQVFVTEVGEYNADRKLYSTRSSFLTKDGKIRMCGIWEVTEILNNNGVVYWEETYFSILHILVSDKTETIKKLVRQKENYNVEVRFANLFWGRPKSHGWFKLSALEEFKSTEGLRKIQEILNLKKEEDDPAKSQPVYFITEFGDEVEERVMADIIDVQIVETEK